MSTPNHQQIHIPGGGTVYSSYPTPASKIPPQQTPLLNPDGTMVAAWYRFLFAPWFSNADKIGNQTGYARADNIVCNTLTLNGTVVPPPTGSSPITITTPVSGSDYTATQQGTLIVYGGTVTSANFIRGTVVPLNVPLGPIPMSVGDNIAVFYTAAPTFTFIPY